MPQCLSCSGRSRTPALSSKDGEWTTMSTGRTAHWQTCLRLRLPMSSDRERQQQTESSWPSETQADSVQKSGEGQSRTAMRPDKHRVGLRKQQHCALTTRAHIAIFCAQISTIHRRFTLHISERNQLPKRNFPAVSTCEERIIKQPLT